MAEGQNPQQSFDPSPETIMCIMHFMQIMQIMQAFRLNGPVDPQATRQYKSAFDDKFHQHIPPFEHALSFFPSSQYMSPAIMIQSHVPGRSSFITLGRSSAAFSGVIYRQPGNRNPVFLVFSVLIRADLGHTLPNIKIRNFYIIIKIM